MKEKTSQSAFLGAICHFMIALLSQIYKEQLNGKLIINERITERFTFGDVRVSPKVKSPKNTYKMRLDPSLLVSSKQMKPKNNFLKSKENKLH